MNNDSLTLDTIWDVDASCVYENNPQSLNSKFKNIYKPSLIKEGVKRYISLLKFLPNAKNKNKLIVCKRELFLINPLTKRGWTVDISANNTNSIIITAFRLCKNSKSDMIKDLAKNFSSGIHFFSLVQIIEDEVHPELNNRVKIFKFGDKIHKMILETGNPSSKHKEPNNIFNLKSGKLFQLNISKNSNDPIQTDYSACEFLEKTSLPIIDDKKCSDPERILKFLTDEVPDLLEHEYQEWDSNTIKYVADCIYKILPPNCEELNALITEYPEIMSSTLNGYAFTEKVEERPVQKTKNPPVEEKQDEVFDYDDNVSQKSKKKEESPKKVSKTDDDDDEDNQLEDFLNDDKKPQTKKKPSKTVEDDDIEDELDDEEEKPKKSSKKVSKKDDDDIDYNDLIDDE